MKSANLIITIIALAAMIQTAMAQSSYADGFEEGNMNPYWSVSGPGTASLTNALAHTGSQSLQLSASPTFPWQVEVEHAFAANVSGSVSVWIYGNQLCCSSGAAIQVNDSSGKWLAILQQGGNSNCESCFIARVNGSRETDYFFNADATIWHQLEIDTAASGVTFKFDGAAVFSNASVTSFAVIDLSVWGGPGGTAYFDDFSFTASSYAPTPKALYVSYFGSGGGMLEITPDGVASHFGSGGFAAPAGLAFSPSGNLYASDSGYPNTGGGAIYAYGADGSRSTYASGINPYGLAFDASGNLFASDAFTLEIYKFASGGARSIFATGVYDIALAFDHNGNLFGGDNYPASGPQYRIDEYSPTGSVSTFAATEGYITGLAFDSSGNLFAAVTGGGSLAQNGILKFTPTGNVSVFAPSNTFVSSAGLAFDNQGNLYAADQGADIIYKFAPDGARSTFTSLGPNIHPFALTFASFPAPADTTPPVISPTITGRPGNNGWYTSDVIVTWSVTDAESAITSQSGCDPSTISSDTFGTTLSCTATSAGGIATQSVTIKRDATAPAINTLAPAPTSYLLNQAVAATYSCSDATSGVTSCTGTVANGANFNTASPGSKIFTVSAVDNAGNAATSSTNYTVNYNFSGYAAPVANVPALNTGKAGRTYPLKWQLTDANGNYVSALSAVKSVTYQQSAACSASGSADTLTAVAEGGGLKYDSTANQFIYNWSTPSVPGCYTLFVTLDSGQAFPAYFNLK